MRCPLCQHDNRPGERFCVACGVEMAGAGSPESAHGGADRLAGLGDAALEDDDRDAARAWFEESLTLALAVPGSDRVPRLLESFAALAASGQDYARALALAGAAATVRDITGAPAVDGQEGTVRWLARAHDCLGRRAAREAWRRGQQMSFEEAVEYALHTVVSD